jgi:hypothetical protein
LLEKEIKFSLLTVPDVYLTNLCSTSADSFQRLVSSRAILDVSDAIICYLLLFEFFHSSTEVINYYSVKRLTRGQLLYCSFAKYSFGNLDSVLDLSSYF